MFSSKFLKLAIHISNFKGKKPVNVRIFITSIISFTSVKDYLLQEYLIKQVLRSLMNTILFLCCLITE